MNNLNHSRKLAARFFVAALLLTGAFNALAEVHYVDVNSTNAMSPYTSWVTAATNIQDAVDAAAPGDEIVVMNGIYATGGRSRFSDYTMNRVAVDKPLNVRSLNGPQLTIIDGGHSNRCVYLTNGASLSGFTLTNGRAQYGGGLWCESTNAVVSNCVVSGNSTFARTNGCCVYSAFAGGVYGGTLDDCIFSNNWAEAYTDCGFSCDRSTCTRVSVSYDCYYYPGYGGGAANATLNNCTLTGNSAGHGGGAYSCTLNNCTLTGNGAQSGGGATFSALNNCTLIGNSASEGGGTKSCTLNNCTLTGNWSVFGGGASGGTLNNCTLIANSAAVSGGGASVCFVDDGDGGTYLVPVTLNNCTLTGNSATNSGGGAYGGTLHNCVVYYNTSTNGANYYSSTLNYSCTTPLPTNGVGNIANAPLFVNSTAGNYRLRPDSPCIDAGTNLSASITNDLDGRPRPLDGNGNGLAAFDMGAYEYRTPLLVWQDSPNPTPPHAQWATAAHTIQDAVDAAVAGDEIVVTNGVYATGGRLNSRVAVDKPLSIRSMNGPEFTMIDGGRSVTCVAQFANGASLSGFTLTNGHSYLGGGAYGGTLNNCTLTRNFARYGGGGVARGTLNNCTLTGNVVYGDQFSEQGDGGGAYFSTLNNCTLTDNSAYEAGGGAFGGTLNNCTLSGNSSWYGGGVADAVLNNCIAYFNTGPGAANYDSSSSLNYSCTTPQPTNGVGNISNAPLFVDTNGWSNLRLQSNSPCINAGWNTFAPAGSDLDGNPRIVGGSVDIGAYEFQSLDLLNFGVVSNRFGFTITGQPNWLIVLEASSDFANWTPLTTNTLAGSPFPFSDPTPPNLSQRFYRARIE